MFKGPAAQRLVVVFIAGWLLFSFPLLALWDRDVTVFGLPLFPTALFSVWAVLLAVAGRIAERAED